MKANLKVTATDELGSNVHMAEKVTVDEDGTHILLDQGDEHFEEETQINQDAGAVWYRPGLRCEIQADY